jgi:hypothetical protein
MDQLPLPMQDKLRELVGDLVAGNYQAMEARGLLRPNTAEGTKETIERYPGQITLPPPEAFETIRELIAYAPRPENESSWMIVFDLWFDHQPTHVVLEATYTERSNGETSIIVEGIV